MEFLGKSLSFLSARFASIKPSTCKKRGCYGIKIPQRADLNWRVIGSELTLHRVLCSLHAKHHTWPACTLGSLNVARLPSVCQKKDGWHLPNPLKKMKALLLFNVPLELMNNNIRAAFQNLLLNLRQKSSQRSSHVLRVLFEINLKFWLVYVDQKTKQKRTTNSKSVPL